MVEPAGLQAMVRRRWDLPGVFRDSRARRRATESLANRLLKKRVNPRCVQDKPYCAWGGRSQLAGDFHILNRPPAGDKNRCSPNLKRALESAVVPAHHAAKAAEDGAFLATATAGLRRGGDDAAGQP